MDIKKGVGSALIQLASALERAEKYSEACQLLYSAKKLLRHHITYITARDSLRGVSGRHQIPPEVYETRKTPDELIDEFFDDYYVKGKRPLPVIIADDDHQQIVSREGFEPPPYEVLPGPGFILDLGSYRLPIPPGYERIRPNIIQIVRGQGQIYWHSWEESIRRYELTAKTLNHPRDIPEFSHLQAGETLILAIGRFMQPTQPGKNQAQFIPYWVAQVIVDN
jgi:hypothetical protein